MIDEADLTAEERAILAEMRKSFEDRQRARRKAERDAELKRLQDEELEGKR